MKARAPALGLILLACLRQAVADQPQQPLAPASTAEDRLMFSANGAWLTGGSGGGGASALWSHTFAPQDAINVGAEYQQVANSHWTNGILSGSFGLGSGTPAPAIYFEAHEGAGDIALRSFRYSVVTAGLLAEPTEWLTVQLETRQIDVDTTHGNLPKLNFSFRVAKPLLISASYADTVGGNLGTRLASLRFDYLGQTVTALAGAARGPVAPAVISLIGQTQIVQRAPWLTELFAGAGRSFGRTEWQLIADHQDVEGFKRLTISLLCTLHLGERGRAP